MSQALRGLFSSNPLLRPAATGHDALGILMHHHKELLRAEELGFTVDDMGQKCIQHLGKCSVMLVLSEAADGAVSYWLLVLCSCLLVQTMVASCLVELPLGRMPDWWFDLVVRNLCNPLYK